MVKIKKGNIVTLVPQAAYETIFKPQGWVTKDNKNAEKIETKEIKKEIEIPENTETENNIDFDNMSLSALKKYAADNNIDISGATTKKEIRNILENNLDI